MALINCPECGKGISDKAKMCPHCGVNIEDLTFCENCKHLINPTDAKCPNCNTATPWARKCPECGEAVSVTDETCPKCGFNLFHHFGKVNITSSSIRTASTTTHQNNYYDELEEDVVRCPDCECELPENWEELRECPQCGCKFERPLSYKLKDNKNNFIIAGVGVLLCILAFILLRDSYYTNDFYLVFNDGEFILSTLLMVVGIIMIIYAGFKSSYDFQNAKNISYGISGAVVFGILLTVLASNGLISKSEFNNISVAEAERAAEEREAMRIEAERRKPEGTYEVVDVLNIKWIIILNSDKSVNIHKEGSNFIAYGSWSDGHYDGGIWLDMDEMPRITFPNLGGGFFGHGDIKEGYLYLNVNSATSKNPNRRLQLKKIK